MQSIAVYGRLVVRAVLSELTSELPRALPWHGSIASAQPLRRSFHLVTAASGLSKTHSTLASSQNLLKPRTFGDDACFVARHSLGDVIGLYYVIVTSHAGRVGRRSICSISYLFMFADKPSN